MTDPPDAGLSNYARFFEQEAYLRVLTNTFWIAIISTVDLPRHRLPVRVPDDDRARAGSPASCSIAVLLPFWSSLLVRTFAWQVILRDTGIINRFLIELGRDLRAVDADPDDGRRDHRDVPHPAAVHGPADLGRHATDRPRVRPRGGKPRRVAGTGVPPRLPAAQRCRASSPAASSCSSSPSASTSRRRCSAGLRDQMISQLIVQQVQQRLDWGFGTAMSVLLMADHARRPARRIARGPTARRLRQRGRGLRQ